MCDDDTHTGQPPAANGGSLLVRKGRKSHYKGSQPLALFSQAEWSNHIPQTTLLLELRPKHIYSMIPTFVSYNSYDNPLLIFY